MGRCDWRAIFVIGLLVAITMQKTYAIKCWKCSSEFPYTFCNDPFSPLEHQNRWAYMNIQYIECVPPQDEIDLYIERNRTASCRKLEVFINDEFLTIRDCIWKLADDDCFYNKFDNDIYQLESCTTCDTDGCNDVSDHNSSALHLLRSSGKLSILSTLLSCSLWIRSNYN